MSCSTSSIYPQPRKIKKKAKERLSFSLESRWYSIAISLPNWKLEDSILTQSCSSSVTVTFHPVLITRSGWYPYRGLSSSLKLPETLERMLREQPALVVCSLHFRTSALWRALRDIICYHMSSYLAHDPDRPNGARYNGIFGFTTRPKWRLVRFLIFFFVYYRLRRIRIIYIVCDELLINRYPYFWITCWLNYIR